jgi:hypothetical protein
LLRPWAYARGGPRPSALGAARSLASLPGCAIPSRSHTSIRYGEQFLCRYLMDYLPRDKGGMHCDLTKSDLDEALLSQSYDKAAPPRQGVYGCLMPTRGPSLARSRH